MATKTKCPVNHAHFAKIKTLVEIISYFSEIKYGKLGGALITAALLLPLLKIEKWGMRNLTNKEMKELEKDMTDIINKAIKTAEEEGKIQATKKLKTILKKQQIKKL